MSSSTGSGDVVDECAWWSAESVVEADGGGEGEEACADAGSEAVEGAGSVAFEGEQVFAGLEDRFDSLSDRREVRPLAGFVFAAGPADRRVELGGAVFEVSAGVAFVADHGQVSLSFDAGEERDVCLALRRLGGGECQRARGAVQREQGVQTEAPEEAAVACAVAVVGGVGALAASGRLDA